MKASIKTGLSFGLTSGVITTLGLMVGLHAGTQSRAAVLGGILTIAVADALSDALGIHITEEAHNRDSTHVWESTAATFAVKFLSAASFALPVLLFPLAQAVTLSILWGLALLALFSWLMARSQRLSPWTIVGEHLLIALAVIAATYYVGRWVGGAAG
jgi:vacuolar iron transporter family protein